MFLLFGDFEDFSFERLLLRQVRDHRHQIMAVAESHVVHRQKQGKGAAVFALTRHPSATADNVAFACLQITPNIGVVLAAIGLRHEAGNILVNKF